MAGSKKAPAGSSKVSPLSSFLTLCHRFSLNNAKNPGTAGRDSSSLIDFPFTRTDFVQ
jgi:hypothetical protein